MLQQTQVDRTVPYFIRWMKRFPTVNTLAEASLGDVLKEWSGLGYNRRAKLLRACAQMIVEKHQGKVPRGTQELNVLPGIGPYTTGAIRAFAFNEPDVFIETNIRAALIHHFFPKSNKIDDKKLKPILAACLDRIVSTREWYAALMDYGSHLKKEHANPSRRSKHHMVQANFEGSTRQVRGAIIRRLLSGPIPEAAILSVNAKDAYQISKALRALQAEGMIEKRGVVWRLVKG